MRLIKFFFQQKILNINYKYVIDKPEREDPGNIGTFLKWFGENVKVDGETHKETTNVLIITHSHVIKAASGMPASNNAGFIISTELQDNKIIYDTSSIKGIWPQTLAMRLKCPTKRCDGVCDN